MIAPRAARALTLAGAAVAATLACGMARADDTGDDQNVSLMVGGGGQYMPSWMGAANRRLQPVPFIVIDWPNVLTLSTVDGVNLDLIGGPQLHGGLYGNYQWGRESVDLQAPLRGKLNTLSPRLQAGGYLEYQVNRGFSFGANVSHDTQGAGAYLNVYVDQGLPGFGRFEHGLELQWQVMNGPAMRRFFGLTPEQATALNVTPWQPSAGAQGVSLAYNAFLPTGKHFGFVLQVEYLRLLGDAHDSPLVQMYGSANQVTTSLAFVWRE